MDRGTSSPVLRAFNNSLVADKIVSYLGYKDMTALSQVSREFCRTIRETRRFRNVRRNGAVILSTEVDPWELLTILNKSQYAWDRFKIHVPLPLRHIDILNEYLRDNVKFISLVPASFSSVTAIELFTVLLRMFKYTPMLTELQMTKDILPKEVFQNPIDAFQVTQGSQNLVQVILQEQSYWRKPFVTCVVQKTCLPIVPTFLINLLSDLENVAVQKFIQFALYSSDLESFQMKHVIIPEQMFSHYSGVERYIPLILEENQNTLRDLSLSHRIWRNEEVSWQSFPVLRTLNLKCSTEDPWLQAFLGRHHFLQELEVVLKAQGAKSFLSEIGRHADKLTKLHIEVKDLCAVYYDKVPVDWRFLRGMRVLKDFQISVTQTQETTWKYFGSGAEFLAALPQGQLERLSFRGLTYGFWKSLIKNEVEMSIRMSLFRGFRGLKSLSFIRCTNPVNDVFMQFILRELKDLEELEITDCKYLTDFGVTGITTDELGIVINKEVSLSNLKSLQHLVIRRCPCVTTVSLISSLSLPHLKLLEFSSAAQVDEELVLKLLAQNPELNKVKLNFPIYPDLCVLHEKWRATTQRHVEFVRLTNDLEANEELLD